LRRGGSEPKPDKASVDTFLGPAIPLNRRRESRESLMSFAAGLRHALDLRQSDVVSELKRGDSLEDILNRHLLTVEKMSDSEILTSVLLLSPD
jgi:hypothetical protein